MSAMWRGDDASRPKVGESPNVMRTVRDHRCELGLPTFNQPRSFQGWDGESAYRFGFWGRLGALFGAISGLKLK